MLSNIKKLIAVIGAAGHQGGGVIRALKAGGQFKVRALTRNPGQHRALADEVIEADLNRPETLAAAFKGAHGVFLVTTSSLEGTDERKQGTAAVKAASDAGVKHVVWSTLPDVEAISGSRSHVPHFTNKAKVDRIVKDARFANHTFVIAPFFYQNLAGAMAPQQKADGSMGWALRSIRVCVAFIWVTFANNEIVDVLNRQGHNFSFTEVPADAFATLFPGAGEIAAMFRYFEAHTYLGSESRDRIAFANKIAGRQPTKFSTWARLNVPVQTP